MGTIAPGTQGMALTDTPEDGAPVQIGASVDNTAPTAAAEGDVRRIRSSPSGGLFNALLNGGSAGDAFANNAGFIQAIDDVNRFQGVILYGFNGTDFDRLRSAASNGDAVAALALGLLQTTTVPLLFNGATFDRLRGDTNGLQAQGTVAHDAVDAGNPAAIGGFATQDVSAEAGVAAGDRVRGIFTLKGAQIIAASSPAGDAQNANAVRTLTEGDAENLLGVLGYAIAPDGLSDRLRSLGDVAQDGLGQLCVAAAVPGAGVVQATRVFRSSDTTRLTAITPSAGNRVRIIAVIQRHTSTTGSGMETYFGTGANMGTDATKSISECNLDVIDLPSIGVSFGDGAGPVGAVDDVVSVRQNVSSNTSGWVIIFREE